VLVRLLGSIDVVDDDGGPRHIGGPKECATLAVLAVHANSWVSDGFLIDCLWGDRPPPSATRTLQKYVSRIRGVVSDDATLVVERSTSGYRLRAAPHALDTTRLDSLLASAREASRLGNPGEAESLLREAEALFRGPPLGELAHTDFARAEAARLEALQLVVLEDRIDSMLAQGRAAEAAADLAGLSAVHPLHERFFALRMIALYRCGRQSDALRVYQELRRTLADQLGIDPSPDLRKLEQAILEQSPDLLAAAEPRPNPSPMAERGHLPMSRSSFVGREREMQAVTSAIGPMRIVTLTGIGGCGKTRLALEVARRVSDRYADGAFLVELGLLDDGQLLPQTVAAALGVHLINPSGTDIAGYLSARSQLLVLDNCEHLIDDCAELVDEILAVCPSVHILATSREPLSVEGEHVYSVPSLPIETDAVSLFVERAESVRAGIGITTEVRETVAKICLRLDGIPLAIELAAAHVGHLRPAEILDRLSDRFRLLTGGRRRVARQHTLRAALDWSHDLLREDEKEIFRRLAVFRGSFSLGSVEDICGGDVLPLLGALVSKSLVVAEIDADVTRYRLLETVRFYAEEKLVEARESETYRTRHRDSFLNRIETAPREQFYLSNVAEWLLDDADNLRAALEWSRQQDRPDLVMRIASRMVGYWGGFARNGELAMWAQYGLASCAEVDRESRGKALFVAASSAQLSGDFVAMEALSAEALEFLDPESWEAARTWLLQILFWAFMDPVRARTAARQGMLAASAASAPEYTELITYFAVGASVFEGDYDAVLAQLGEGRVGTVTSSHLRAVLLALRGDIDGATEANACVPGNTTFALHIRDVSNVLIAVLDRRDDAPQLLAAVSRAAVDHALPLADVDCVLLFAELAIAEGDHRRAACLLATARAASVFPFRWHGSFAIYQHCVGAVRQHLDRAAVAQARERAAAISVHDALQGELARLR
jgi:predicted ATPase/DNA-binding SARP family transcriptional activator